jgi:hypothetical protein
LLVIIGIGVVLVLVACALGCYSKTYTVTATERFMYYQETADGRREILKVPAVVQLSWTKRYLLKPNQFPSAVLDDPYRAAKMMRETEKMRAEHADVEVEDAPRLAPRHPE